MCDIDSDVILTQAEEAEYSVIVNDRKIKDEMVAAISWFGSVAATNIMANRYNVSPRVFAACLYDWD